MGNELTPKDIEHIQTTYEKQGWRMTSKPTRYSDFIWFENVSAESDCKNLRYDVGCGTVSFRN